MLKAEHGLGVFENGVVRNLGLGLRYGNGR